MQIVDVEQSGDDNCVRTIDVWFSKRRQVWVVERLDADGSQIGAAHLCPDPADIGACISDWLSRHNGIEFVDIEVVATHRVDAERPASVQKRPRRAA